MGTVTTFDSDKKHLTYLLQQIEQRDLALPDFQRDFAWKPGETREFVRSVMQSFPAGTILLMQGGAKHFKPRSFAQAPAHTRSIAERDSRPPRVVGLASTDLRPVDLC